MSKNRQDSDPITPRTLQTTKDETIIVLWTFFKWLFTPFIITVLWEHFAELLHARWKPTFFIDLFRTYVVEPFWKLSGTWLAYLSGFVELLKLKELFATIGKIGDSLLNLLLCAKVFVKSYTDIIIAYEWTLNSTIVGSVIIFILISIIVYLLRNRIYIFWTNCMKTCRYYRLKINSMFPSKTALTTINNSN